MRLFYGSLYFNFIFVLILFIYPNNQLLSQTYSFSNTDTQNLPKNSTVTKSIPVSGVPTSGVVLQQVNFHMGNMTGNNNGDLANFTLALRDPLSNQVILLSSSSFTTVYDANRRVVQLKFRDHPALNTPQQQQSYSPANTISNGYPFHQGYYRPQQSFSTLNTTSSVNGNWELRILTPNPVLTYNWQYNSVELIFGPPLDVIDIRGTDPNQSCASKQCIQTNQRYWARNNGYPHSQPSSPPFTVDGCNWNGENNNMAWFYFVASGTTANISLSGFQTTQESSVFKTTNCVTYQRVTGGCAPSDLFSGATHSMRYFIGNYAGGFRYNHEYFLSGLSIGDQYIVVIDGQSGTQSNFYIELLSGGDIGCSALPVDFVGLDYECNSIGVSLSWSTATETNNDFFTVEKSTDGKNWYELGSVNGKGSTVEYSNYRFTDFNSNIEALTYYRLKQTDYDGKFEYLETISVNCANDSNGNAFVYPNPSDGNFKVFGINNGDYVKVYNAVGSLIWEGVSTSNFVHIDAVDGQDGIFFIHIHSEDDTQVLKALKK